MLICRLNQSRSDRSVEGCPAQCPIGGGPRPQILDDSLHFARPAIERCQIGCQNIARLYIDSCQIECQNTARLD
jgi:hypothetical protein